MLVLSKLTVQPIRYLIRLIKQVPKVKSLGVQIYGSGKKEVSWVRGKEGGGSAYVDMVVLKTITDMNG